MNKKIKILGMSDSLLIATGYAMIMRYMFNYLSEKPSKYELFHSSWHYHGMPIKDATFEDGEKLKFTIYSGGQHPWGKDMLPYYIQKFKPDIFFTLCDSFFYAQDGPNGPINYWFNQINTSPAKTVLYFPSDGEPFPQGCENVLKKFDYNVSMSKFGQEQVKRQFGIDTMYIPHCVNCNKFYKMNNKEELKAKWNNQVRDCNGNGVDLRTKRILLCVARNQGRKMLSHLPKIMEELYKDTKYKDVILLFKSDPYDAASGGVDMISLCKHHNISDKVFWTQRTWIDGYTLTEMREIYNLADMFVLPSSGEGWDIPLTESLSCEVPVVVTNCTAMIEQVDGDERQLAKVANTLTGTFNVERFICDNVDMLEKIKFFLDNPEVAKETGRKNRLKVLKEYDTKVVLHLWEELFQKIVWE